MAKPVIHGNEIQLRSHEYVVLDSDALLKRPTRRSHGDWTGPEMNRGFAFEVVRALQSTIRSYADYRILQQWA